MEPVEILVQYEADIGINGKKSISLNKHDIKPMYETYLNRRDKSKPLMTMEQYIKRVYPKAIVVVTNAKY